MHLQCKPATTMERKSLAVKVDGPPRGRGRPKRSWMEKVKIDLKKYNISEDLDQETELM